MFTPTRISRRNSSSRRYVEAYNKAEAKMNEIKGIVRDAVGEGMSEEELNKETKALILAYVRSEPAAKQLKEMGDTTVSAAISRGRGGRGNTRSSSRRPVEGDLGEEEKITLYYENAANRIEATRIYSRLKADPLYKDMNIAVEPNRQEAETSFMGPRRSTCRGSWTTRSTS